MLKQFEVDNINFEIYGMTDELPLLKDQTYKLLIMFVF